ncbi:hypothetical protein BDR07DRAFT_1491419 [Suillus spraguei]|nr:hypothetical protein BDR07DRAFT_1491419 [Suillus spraguei]
MGPPAIIGNNIPPSPSVINKDISTMGPWSAAVPNVGQAQPKGKGKEKAMDITEPVRGCSLQKADAEEYNLPCKRCIEEPCLVVVSRRGQAMKSCTKCHNMKVQCNQPVPKAAPASKSMGRTTRAISYACQPTPILESEEGVEDTGVKIQPNLGCR